MPLFLGSDINETLKITTLPSQVQNYHHIPEWHHHAYISEMRSQQPKINFVCGCVCVYDMSVLQCIYFSYIQGFLQEHPDIAFCQKAYFIVQCPVSTWILKDFH